LLGARKFYEFVKRAGRSRRENGSELREITSYRNAIAIVTVIAFA
jgi:hypothetical protein